MRDALRQSISVDWFRESVTKLDHDVSVGISLSATLPTFSLDDIAAYLTDGFWIDSDFFSHKFDVAPGGTLTFDISGLNADGQFFALTALEAWSFVTGINFVQVGSDAEITFDDDQPGAFAGADEVDFATGIIALSSVNIGTNWIIGDEGNLNSYSFQTYMHEIGHALGLGHAGNYNVTGDYAEDGSGDNHYLNDSWQVTLMSYFGQFEATAVDASYAYTMTPMIADIIAIQNLYGVAGNLRLGDTIYGENSTAGGYYDTAFLPDTTFTLLDDGGIDTINFHSVTADMIIDLSSEGISDVGGLIGNMLIARGTVIENFISGWGADTIVANSAENYIKGRRGDDTIYGLDGADLLKGNIGDDTIYGGNGNDIIRGGYGNDTIYGNNDDDRLAGDKGNDTLFGGQGADKLFGLDGIDTLDGGTGNDRLVGGADADIFVFSDGYGADKIADFTDDVDTIVLDAALWGGGLTVADMLGIYAKPVNGTTVLDFGGGNQLTINGLTDVNFLLDDISIV